MEGASIFIVCIMMFMVLVWSFVGLIMLDSICCLHPSLRHRNYGNYVDVESYEP